MVADDAKSDDEDVAKLAPLSQHDYSQLVLDRVLSEIARFTPRIVETLVLGRDSVERQVTTQIKIPDMSDIAGQDDFSEDSRTPSGALTVRLEIPIKIVHKDSHSSVYDVHWTNGTDVPTLERREAGRRVEQYLESLFTQLCSTFLNESNSKHRRFVSRIGLIESIVLGSGQTAADALASIRAALPRNISRSAKEHFAKFFDTCDEYVSHAAIIISVYARPGERIIMGWSEVSDQTEIAGDKRNENRAAAGWTPRISSVDTSLAAMAQSYHFKVPVPAGYYASDFTFTTKVTADADDKLYRTRVPRKDELPRLPVVHLHLVMKRRTNTEALTLSLVTTFKERSRGSHSAAVIAYLMSLVPLILFISDVTQLHALSTNYFRSSETLGSIMPIAIAAASVCVAFCTAQMSRPRVFRMPQAAFNSLVTTALSSVAAGIFAFAAILLHPITWVGWTCVVVVTIIFILSTIFAIVCGHRSRQALKACKIPAKTASP